MSFNIRKINAEEIEFLIPVLKSVIEKLSYYNDIARQNELEKYNSTELSYKISQDPESVLIAEENNKIIGFCLSRLDDMLLWIEWFGVIETSRKQGIARKLVEYLESTATKRNAHKVWCDCRTENIKSINLLSSSGYQPICTLKNHWYHQDFILWQKEISNNAIK